MTTAALHGALFTTLLTVMVPTVTVPTVATVQVATVQEAVEAV